MDATRGRRCARRADAGVEGDQATALDAERIRACGVSAVQVNTGKGCHLDAPMVAAALQRLHGHFHDHAHSHPHDHGFHADHGHPHDRQHGEGHAAAHPEVPHPHPAAPEERAHGAGGLLFIENVGNLVCPALWDLGERARVVLLSVPEGDDKPLKYPDMFTRADLLLITKADLLPHVPFDVGACVERARRCTCCATRRAAGWPRRCTRSRTPPASASTCARTPSPWRRRRGAGALGP